MFSIIIEICNKCIEPTRERLLYPKVFTFVWTENRKIYFVRNNHPLMIIRLYLSHYFKSGQNKKYSYQILSHVCYVLSYSFVFFYISDDKLSIAPQ